MTAETDTYEMEYICINCGTHFNKQIPKGLTADSMGGICPYCGREDSYSKPFYCRKPGLPRLTEKP